MYQAPFQLNKIRRLITTQGKEFMFLSPSKNDFGEPNGETDSHQVRGVLHEASAGYITRTAADASTTRYKSQTMLLTLWESAEELTLECELKLNNKTYKVNEISNLLQADLVADISLEEVHS